MNKFSIQKQLALVLMVLSLTACSGDDEKTASNNGSNASNNNSSNNSGNSNNAGNNSSNNGNGANSGNNSTNNNNGNNNSGSGNGENSGSNNNSNNGGNQNTVYDNIKVVRKIAHSIPIDIAAEEFMKDQAQCVASIQEYRRIKGMQPYSPTASDQLNKQAAAALIELFHQKVNVIEYWSGENKVEIIKGSAPYVGTLTQYNSKEEGTKMITEIHNGVVLKIPPSNCTVSFYDFNHMAIVKPTEILFIQDVISEFSSEDNYSFMIRYPREIQRMKRTRQQFETTRNKSNSDFSLNDYETTPIKLNQNVACLRKKPTVTTSTQNINFDRVIGLPCLFSNYPYHSTSGNPVSIQMKIPEMYVNALIEKYRNGTATDKDFPGNDYVFQSIEVNTQIDPKVFEIPEFAAAYTIKETDLSQLGQIPSQSKSLKIK